jgi:hypothetical protein
MDLIKVDDAKTCLECKLAVTTVINDLKSPVIQQEVVKALQGACASLPSSLQSVCSVTVSQYGPELVTYVANWLENENVCKAIKFCPN